MAGKSKRGAGDRMKKINKEMLVRTLKIFGSLTVIITLVGYFFGNILGAFLEPAAGPPMQTIAAPNEDGADLADSDEDTATAVAEVVDPTNFFVVQLGIFSSLDNAAGLVGSLSALGLPTDLIRVDGNFMLYSHIVGSRSQLEEVEAILNVNNIDFFVREGRQSGEELAWEYFLLAANEIPFNMTVEFINSFANDEMHIFGFFSSLSNTSFEPLAEERQNMLMTIYNWLNS